jgi:hypothetical protein
MLLVRSAVAGSHEANASRRPHRHDQPIVEAWRRCSREERLEFLECCEFDLAKLRRERDGELIDIKAEP